MDRLRLGAPAPLFVLQTRNVTAFARENRPFVSGNWQTHDTQEGEQNVQNLLSE